MCQPTEQEQRQNHSRQHNFAFLCDILQKRYFSPFFKLAKILQILAHPQCVGENDRIEVIRNIYRSLFFREPFYPGYSVLEALRQRRSKRARCGEDKVTDVFSEKEPLFEWNDGSEKNIFLPDIRVFSTISETELDIACSGCTVKPYNTELTFPAEQPSLLFCRGRELKNIPREHFEKFHSTYVFFDKNEAEHAGKNAEKLRCHNIFCFAPPQTLTGQWLDVFSSCCIRCDFKDFGKAALVEFCNNAPPAQQDKIINTSSCDGTIIILASALSSGGMEQVIYDMYLSFDRMGKDVLLAVFSPPGKDVILPQGIQPVVLDGNAPETAMKELLGKLRCAAVIAHYCTSGAQAAFEAGIPFLQVIHNCYIWFSAKELKEYTSADRFTTAYISVSAAAAWYAMACVKLPPRKMFIIENTIDADKFLPDTQRRTELRNIYNFRENDFVLVNPASCTPSKGQLNLLLAFAGAYKKHPRLRLVLAGKVQDKQYYSKLQQLISSNDLENVVIHGNYFENMSDIYNMADGVVFSSFWEGCSLAAAEAIQMKRPLVSPRCGDIERQTQENNCVLFDLPFTLTDLNSTNCYKMLHVPDPGIIENLQESICRLAEGDYPSEKKSSALLSMQENFCKYLQIIEAVTTQTQHLPLRKRI